MKCWLSIFCLLVACTKPVLNEVNLIPKPQKLEVHKGGFSLSFNTNLIIDSLFYEESNYLKELLNLKLKGNGNTIKLLKKEGLQEEEFLLNITPEYLKIEASTKKGIMRGIQTLRQLLPDNYEEKGLVTKIPCVEIKDYPRFKWRGMLLDCCRHFMDKEFIKKYIDLLAYHKMNILHWHLTEDQGWRIEIEKYPELTNIGAWREQKDGTIYGGFYSKKDIKEILEYARVRHVTVVPEIELPGHSSAAIASYPYLSCTDDSIKVQNDWGVFKDIYCAGDDSVFAFLENILLEVIDLFPSKYIHIGGDEAPKYKWENCEKCQKRIKDEKLHDEHELQSYFIKRIEKFLNKHNKKLIGWDEILEGGLAPSATVQSWRGIKGGITAAKNGHDVIMSPTSHCYFDYGLDAIDMEKVYHFEPIPDELSEEESKRILGGECNMWSERAPQELIDSKVFPRMLAIAEVLWSSKQKDYKDFYTRVQNHYPKLDALKVSYGFESIPIKSNIYFNHDSFHVSLEKGSQQMDIEYKINDGHWSLYSNPFGIKETSFLYARGIKNNKPYGNLKQKVIKHKGTGKPVKYITLYNENYQAKKEHTLTDGLIGSVDNFRDGHYQGFYGKDFEIIIDLEEITEVKEIKTSFYQYHLSWIILPVDVTYFVSKNGKDFQQIKSIKNKTSAMKEGKFKQEFVFKERDISERYIKVKAKNFGELPYEHPAAGSDSWIFVDEIIIN